MVPTSSGVTRYRLGEGSQSSGRHDCPPATAATTPTRHPPSGPWPPPGAAAAGRYHAAARPHVPHPRTAAPSCATATTSRGTTSSLSVVPVSALAQSLKDSVLIFREYQQLGHRPCQRLDAFRVGRYPRLGGLGPLLGPRPDLLGDLRRQDIAPQHRIEDSHQRREQTPDEEPRQVVSSNHRHISPPCSVRSPRILSWRTDKIRGPRATRPSSNSTAAESPYPC